LEILRRQTHRLIERGHMPELNPSPTVTPREATITLLLFAEVVARYEREQGRPMDDAERARVVALLRGIVAREAR
jgi:hypothetical protein